MKLYFLLFKLVPCIYTTCNLNIHSLSVTHWKPIPERKPFSPPHHGVIVLSRLRAHRWHCPKAFLTRIVIQQTASLCRMHCPWSCPSTDFRRLSMQIEHLCQLGNAFPSIWLKVCSVAMDISHLCPNFMMYLRREELGTPLSWAWIEIKKCNLLFCHWKSFR